MHARTWAKIEKKLPPLHTTTSVATYDDFNICNKVRITRNPSIIARIAIINVPIIEEIW